MRLPNFRGNIHLVKVSKNVRVVLMVALFFSMLPVLRAQHEVQNEAQHEEMEHEGHNEKFKVALALGYTHIPAAFEEGHIEKAVFVPSIGLDFFYHLSSRFSLALVADAELKDYVVDFNREDLNREGVLIITLLGAYEIFPDWDVMLGGGIEFESHKNLAVLRMGIERDISLGSGWSIAPSAIFDFKEDFNTYTLGLAIGKRF